MKNFIKKAFVIRLIVAILVMSIIPAQASAAFDFSGFGDWFKEKISHPAIADEAKNEIGTGLATIKGVALMASNQPLIKVVKVYETFVTAYSSSIDETDSTPFITASGEKVRDGIVAANFLPLGTMIKIPQIFGDKIFVVKDRMASRHADKVDIWFETKELAKSFGRRKLLIYVLQNEIQ